jgi:anti-anti-sigma factor
MDASERLPVTWVGSWAMVKLPAELDVCTSERVAEELIGALTQEVRVLVADMTATVLCDVSGARALMRAHQRAVDQGAGLRLVVPSAWVRQVLGLLAVDRVVPVYPALGLAVADALGLPGLSRRPGP